MSVLEGALHLASLGFHVFPLIANSKLPAIDDYPNIASRSEKVIRAWWIDPVMGFEQPYNVGISTSRYRDNEALLVVDVDNKGDKKGDDEILRLELEGRELPTTFEQLTPTGGRHLIYRIGSPVKQGSDVLARGLDVRSRGGYIVGASSSIEGRAYTTIYRDIAAAPQWVIDTCGHSPERKSRENKQDLASDKRVDASRANARGIHYLTQEAPLALEGSSGDHTTFLVACKLKDLGVTEEMCSELMFERWNNRCSPPWSSEELQKKVENAYSYGLNAQGSDAPETQFEKIETKKDEVGGHPFDILNSEYAYILTGGSDHILRETKDHRSQFHLQHLDIDAFHRKLSHVTMNFSGRTQAVSKIWISSAERRSYDGLCFLPGKTAPKNFYNLWRGFSVEPMLHGPNARQKASLDAFLEHALVNVCKGDTKLANWLISYFAHIVQRPWEKPLVALVMRGRKGVGKNALIERMGFLLGESFAVVSNRRYLTGNFNSLLENKLMLTLDEAFWSGDKAAEGVLKDLITGEYHRIERKGKEPYRVENCLRVAILGNEDWLVPASQDERRFAVFNVGDGRKQDRRFFREMREGMEAGGYSLLLSYLQEYKIECDVTEAPKTQGLADQKLSSLSPIHQWWHDCLTAGEIVLGDFGAGWPTRAEKGSFRASFVRYLKERNIGGWVPNDSSIGKAISECAPTFYTRRIRIEGERSYFYEMPSLNKARQQFEEFIGHAIAWPTYVDETDEKEIFA